LKRPGFVGEELLFRSPEVEPVFKEEAGETEPGKITHQSYMNSGGSWSLQE
jgi:hypothetical protein